MFEGALVAALFVGLLVFNLGLGFAVCLWEKRMVWPYQSAEEPPRVGPIAAFEPTTPYAPSVALSSERSSRTSTRAWRNADDLGLVPLGTLTDRRGSLYDVRYETRATAERDVLAFLASGRMAGIPYLNIRLCSSLTDGRSVISISNKAGALIDLTGRTVEGLCNWADLDRLLAWHRSRLDRLGVVSPFGPKPLDEWRASRVEQADQLERDGLIRFLDPERNSYRYNARGALIYTIRLYAVMLRRTFWPDTRPSLLAAARRRGPRENL